jgi:hypothetical protein
MSMNTRGSTTGVAMHGKRRIRVVSKPGGTNGYNISVYDADTGDIITNVTDITMTLSATGINRAKVTYCVLKPDGRMLLNGKGNPVPCIVDVEVPEVDVCAVEENQD